MLGWYCLFTFNVVKGNLLNMFSSTGEDSLAAPVNIEDMVCRAAFLNYVWLSFINFCKGLEHNV